MYSDNHLQSAVAAGVMTQDIADAFRQYVANTTTKPNTDAERIRLVSGLNDVFVVIVCALLLIAVGGIAATIEPWTAAISVAAASWALAEFFTKIRHVALPSIVLMNTFVGAIVTTVLLLASATFKHNETQEQMFSHMHMLPALVCGVSAAYAHWRRFHVPMTVATGCVMVASLIYFALLALIPQAKDWLLAILFIAGLAIFVFAMRWDITDKNRETQQSDVAFWLHLVAASMLVHPIFSSLGIYSSTITFWPSFAAIALYILIAAVSLLIDRRALMISALAYVIYAFNRLLQQYEVISLSFAITALIIGLMLLFLAAYWHKCRKWLLAKLPMQIQNYLSPARMS